MLNPQAYSTNSMTELSSIMSNAIENRGCNETQIAKDKKRAKNKSEVRIICQNVFKKEVIGIYKGITKAPITFTFTIHRFVTYR